MRNQAATVCLLRSRAPSENAQLNFSVHRIVPRTGLIYRFSR